MTISEIPQIAEKIMQGKAIAFIGAGASFSANDPDTNKLCQGLLGTRDLLTEMKKVKNYIDDTLSFSDACFMIKNREGKNSLIDFLKTHLDKDIEPLPTHKLLASLQFEAYISMNFDRLMEKALVNERNKVHTIIEDIDVSMLQNNHVPIVKPHGCFSKPATIVASRDEERPFLQKFPLVDCYLKSKLANKTILFIGFSLQDADFAQLHQQLQQTLGDLAPQSYAVFLSPRQVDIEFWKDSKVTIIDCDAGKFLKELKLHILREGATDIQPHEKDDWFNHQFFASLRNIKNLPTETQLIDAFLEKFISEIESESMPITDLVKLGEEGRDKVYGKKPNFEAFKKAADEIINGLLAAADHDAAESFLEDYKEMRSQITKKIEKKWSLAIQKNDNILLFSQSKRVSQLVSSVTKNVQRTCKLYIGECRPKSPGHSFFQDALETTEKLGAVDYEIIFYPDIIVGHLFDEKKITKVIMGAHTIFIDKSGKMEYFVNTAGSIVISQLCEKYKIPLFVIAETDKQRSSSFLTSSSISTTQEVELVDEKSYSIMKDMKARGHSIQILNVGYDLVPSHSLTTYINEV